MPAYTEFEYEASSQSHSITIAVSVGVPPQANMLPAHPKDHRLGQLQLHYQQPQQHLPTHTVALAPVARASRVAPAATAVQAPPSATVTTPAAASAPSAAQAAAAIPIAPLPASVKGYARFIVVALQPHPNAPEQPQHAPATFTVGLRHLVDTLGARRVLRQLTNNFFRQRRQHVQGNLCPHVHGYAPCACPHLQPLPAVESPITNNTTPSADGAGDAPKPATVRQRVHLEACVDGFQCPFVHITPSGWSSRRRWKPFTERRGGLNSQLQQAGEQEGENENEAQEEYLDDQGSDQDTLSMTGSEAPSLPSTPGTPLLGEKAPQLQTLGFEPHHHSSHKPMQCCCSTPEGKATTSSQGKAFDGEWQRYPGVYVSHKNPIKMQRLLAAEKPASPFEVSAAPTVAAAGRAPPLKSRTK